MKHTVKLFVLLAAVLSLVACNKDKEEVRHERDIVYTVTNGTQAENGTQAALPAEKTTIVHLETEAEWQALLDSFCDWTEAGSTVTFYPGTQAASLRKPGTQAASLRKPGTQAASLRKPGTQAASLRNSGTQAADLRNSGTQASLRNPSPSRAGSPRTMPQAGSLRTKDATTYSTTDREAMKRWMAAMEDEGKTVTVSYDEGSGTWSGTAYATAPQPQEDSGPFDSIGATRSLFSIGAGRQVRFSRGNLQYHAGNDTWRFALQQYDCLVLANANASDSCNGWIDLFGWGSTGYDGKMPWAMSMNDSCYADGMQSIAGTHHDWGVHCAIENGGNEAGLWRLLTRAEARYLLEVRAASIVAGVENARHMRAKVNGVHGLIIFPDLYVHPDSVALPVGVNNNGFSTAEGWDDNDYSEADWTRMELAGAVFLSAAGYRVGTTVIDDNITGDRDGRYWTSTLQHTGNASALIASPREVGTTDMEIHDGLAVRLVKEN